MLTPEQYQRARELREFVQGEIDNFREGKATSLTSYARLSEMFGYGTPKSSRTILAPSGLVEARNKAVEESRRGLIPSEELAWLIGIFSAGATPERNGEMNLTSNSQNLLDTFERRGTHVFNLSPVRRADRVSFNSVEIAESLGDLSKDNWHATVLENHGWILRRREYVWKFLEGFFEKSGAAYERDPVTGKNNTELRVFCLLPRGATLISQMMYSVGVENPAIASDGVRVSNIADINFIARNIHAEEEELESLLEHFRRRVSERGLRQKYTRQQLLDEWKGLVTILGHLPTSREITTLIRQGVANVHSGTYADRFGNGSFTQAKEQLAAILQQEQKTDKQKLLELMKQMNPAELREFSAAIRKLFNL